MPNFRSYAKSTAGRTSLSRKSRLDKSSGRGSKVRAELRAARRAFTPLQTAEIRYIANSSLTRDYEVKTAQNYTLNQTLVPTSDTAGFDLSNIIELGPNSSTMLINQGTGQGQRIGNKIKTKKLTVKGVLVPQPYDATTNNNPTPVQVKLFVMYNKTDPNEPPAPALNADFYQSGNTVKGFSNDLIDLYAPINTDKYRVLATKTFKLGVAVGSSASGTPWNAAQAYYANNDFKLNCNFSFDLTKHFPKIVNFQDNSTEPSTRGLWLMVMYVSSSGGAYTSSQRVVHMQYVIDYKYTDD